MLASKLCQGSVCLLIHRVKKSGEILNLEFVWAENGLELKVDVPVVFNGEDACPGLQKGGHLKRIRNRLGYLGPSGHIPSKIEVDVSNLDIGDKVFMRDIEVHPSLKLLSRDEDRPICKLESQKDYQKRERKKLRNKAHAGE